MFETLKRLFGKKQRDGIKESAMPHLHSSTDSVDLATAAIILMPINSSSSNSSDHCDDGSGSYDSGDSCDSGSSSGD